MIRISQLAKLSCAVLLCSSALSMEPTKEHKLWTLQQQFREVDKDTLEAIYDSKNGNMNQILEFFQPEKIHSKNSNNPAINDLAAQLMNIDDDMKEVADAIKTIKFLKVNTENSIKNKIKSITKEYSDIKNDTKQNITIKLLELKNEIDSLKKQKNELPSKYDISHKYHIKRMSLFEDFKDFPELRLKWNEKYNQEEAEEISKLEEDIKSINKKINTCELEQKNLNLPLLTGYNHDYINQNMRYWINLGFGTDFIESISYTPYFSDIYQDYLEERISRLERDIIHLNKYNEDCNKYQLILSKSNSKKENIEQQIFAIEDKKRREEAEQLERQHRAEEERRRIEAERLVMQRRKELEIQRKAEEEKRRREIEQLENNSIDQILNILDANKIDSKDPNWENARDQLIELTKNINTLSWKDKSGDNLLHLASLKGKMGAVVVCLLIKKFPNMINHPSNNGSTPLHLAAFSGNKELINFLLRRGANVSAKSGADNNITVLDAGANWLEGCLEEGDEAEIQNAKEIINILLDALFIDDNDNDKGNSVNPGNIPPRDIIFLYQKNDHVKNYIKNKISEYENARLKRERERAEQQRLHREEQERIEYARRQQEALEKKIRNEEEARRRQEEEAHYQRNRDNTRRYYNYS